MTRPKMGHRSDEITAYLSESLEPAAKAGFEEHLPTCEECRRDMKAQQTLFDRTNKVLTFRRKRTIDEQVARFERMVAAVKRGGVRGG